MANNNFPLTTLQPLQTLDFVLASGERIRTMLLPMADKTGTKIANVDIDVTNAGCTLLQRISRGGSPYDITTAAAKAYEYAQNEASRVASRIVAVHIEGEEFLEKTDVENMVGHAFPVEVV